MVGGLALIAWTPLSGIWFRTVSGPFSSWDEMCEKRASIINSLDGPAGFYLTNNVH